MPRPLWQALSGVFGKDKNTGFLLSAWFIAAWFFYELSPSKLPAYVTGAHVPLAILVAIYFVTQEKEEKKNPLWSALPHFIIFSLLLLALTAAPWVFGFTGTEGVVISISAGLYLICYLINSRYWISGRKVSMLFIVNMAFQLLIWGLIMPRADSFKDSSEKVAKYAASHAFPQSTVLIGNKYGHPPSLPFYLSLDFKNIKEQIDKDSLLMAYLSHEPCVLILNNEQKEFLKENLPEVPFEEISAQLTDRKQKAYYYIFINKRIKY